MERAGKTYNLKLVFSRSAGAPVAPDLVTIGANNGGRSTESSRGARGFHPTAARRVHDIGRFDRQVVLMRNVKLSEGGRATFRLRGD